MSIALLSILKLFGLCLLLKLVIWAAARAIDAWRNLLCASFLAIALQAQSQTPEPDPTPEPEPLTETQRHQKNLEVAAFACVGLVLGRIFFASWKR